MLAESCRSLLREVRFHTDVACRSQWQDQTFENFIEAKCFFVEMLCQIFLMKADMRKIQPAISADHCQLNAPLLQRLSDAGSNEALSTCIDPANSNKQGVLRQK